MTIAGALTGAVGSAGSMSMPGMGHAGGGHAAAAAIPEWLGALAAAAFLVVAVSHLRHLAGVCGQRRPWHACHVLMAIGMGFMYLPAQLDPLAIPSELWRIVFAVAGLLAAAWALTGAERSAVLLWLQTSIALGAMFYMWSSGQLGIPFSWLLVGYFLADAAMWAIDAYRRLDGSPPILGLSLLAAAGAGGGGDVTISAGGVAEAATPLLGELDISASMIVMSLGMAYMFAVMQIGL